MSVCAGDSRPSTVILCALVPAIGSRNSTASPATDMIWPKQESLMKDPSVCASHTYHTINQVRRHLSRTGSIARAKTGDVARLTGPDAVLSALAPAFIACIEM